jgi:hypothetical protein
VEIVVDLKYERQWGGWCSNGVDGSYGVGLWNFIRRGWEEFSSFTRFEWMKAPRSILAMMRGVGSILLRKHFESCLALLA